MKINGPLNRSLFIKIHNYEIIMNNQGPNFQLELLNMIFQ
jgi:hypothetical protein